MPRFAHTDLLVLAEILLTHAGVEAHDARLVAEFLIRADLRGYPGHGIAHIESYVERIGNGLIRLDGKPTVIREGKSTAVMDGGFYIGQIVAHRAMSLAIAKARQHGSGIVAVRHSAHVGRLAVANPIIPFSAASST
jgi:LDH2 family malate/lactate/ureidoglycolate dehydrogenase